MSGDPPVVDGLEEFLALSALQNQPTDETIEGFVRRARAGGLSVARLMVGWRLLDPLYMSQSVYWTEETGIVLDRFRHGEAMSSEEFVRSPIWHVLRNDVEEMRQRIDGTNEPFEFALYDDLRREGFTDYVISKIGFGSPPPDAAGQVGGNVTFSADRPGGGLVLSFASDRPGGFEDRELKALRRLKYMMALAMRTSMEADMRATLATTYLGRSAGEKVLAGQIARGEGQAIDAVIWYCDLRGSTELCESMGVAAYMPLLNDYFGAVAEPIVAQGGQILDFIGDAVLAIFPLSGDAIARARHATAEALVNLGTFRARHPVLAGRADLADVAGIAIATGTVVYGNIGIPTRLTFSVIGPTVNEVARIERLTKVLHEPVLVTRPIADAEPRLWRGRGAHRLDGVAGAAELFAPQASEWQLSVESV